MANDKGQETPPPPVRKYEGGVAGDADALKKINEIYPPETPISDVANAEEPKTPPPPKEKPL